MLSKVIYNIGVSVVLVDMEALLPLNWGDVGGLSKLKMSPPTTVLGS